MKKKNLLTLSDPRTLQMNPEKEAKSRAQISKDWREKKKERRNGKQQTIGQKRKARSQVSNV